MSINVVEQGSDSPNVLLEKRDSQQITDLIEQLDRDLKQTLKRARKKTAKPR
jgi:hypothetical protein